jgi:putative ABC transport system substrate-binding protein
VEFAAKTRIPAIFDRAQTIHDGGLISYGVNRVERSRYAATFADKILNGGKPADLPVEQAMRFEVVINLRAAKRLGLTITPEVLVGVDRGIK